MHSQTPLSRPAPLRGLVAELSEKYRVRGLALPPVAQMRFIVGRPMPSMRPSPLDDVVDLADAETQVEELIDQGVPWLRVDVEGKLPDGRLLLWIDHADHGGALGTGVIVAGPDPAWSSLDDIAGVRSQAN